MATKQAEKIVQTDTDNGGKIVTLPQTPLAAVEDLTTMYAADGQAGMEGTTQESFATPFLYVLQKGSPQVDEASGVAIPEARAGMFYANISGKLFNGKDTGVLLIPCAYRRVFLRWAPRDAGGGFKGEFAPERVMKMLADGELVEQENRLLVPGANGELNPKKCDSFADTRNHYMLLVADGMPSMALLSLGSTQIKKSRMLMSALSDVKVLGPKGAFTPPTFANLVRAKTVPESNDKGNWFGIHFALEGRVTDPGLYKAAKDFHAAVMAGQIEHKYEAEAAVGGGAGEDLTGSGGKF